MLHVLLLRLHRQPKHLLDFLLAELGTSGSVDGNNQLIIKGRFQQKQIENVLRRYIKEYVTCHTCRSPDTILQKDTRLFFLQCETCGSRCSVASIKSGFQVTILLAPIVVPNCSCDCCYCYKIMEDEVGKQWEIWLKFVGKSEGRSHLGDTGVGGRIPCNNQMEMASTFLFGRHVYLAWSHRTPVPDISSLRLANSSPNFYACYSSLLVGSELRIARSHCGSESTRMLQVLSVGYHNFISGLG